MGSRHCRGQESSSRGGAPKQARTSSDQVGAPEQHAMGADQTQFQNWKKLVPYIYDWCARKRRLLTCRHVRHSRAAQRGNHPGSLAPAGSQTTTSRGPPSPAGEYPARAAHGQGCGPARCPAPVRCAAPAALGPQPRPLTKEARHQRRALGCAGGVRRWRALPTAASRRCTCRSRWGPALPGARAGTSGAPMACHCRRTAGPQAALRPAPHSQLLLLLLLPPHTPPNPS